MKAFDGIQNCTFLADGIKMTHFGATNLSSFLGILKNHYQSALMKMILPVLANLNILGNPISLAQSIGSGFKDLV